MTVDASSTAFKHWATLDGDELCRAVWDKFKTFIEQLVKNKEIERMSDAALAYYGNDREGHSSARTDEVGDKGEARALKVNHFRSVVTGKLTLATAETPGLVPVPANTDSDAMNEAQQARGIIDYYFDDGEGLQEAYEAAEMAEVLQWAWVDVPWDESLGPVREVQPTAMHPETGEVTATREVHEGDIRFEAKMPTDVAFDYMKKNRHLEWVIVRDWVNKFDLAAQVEAGVCMADASPEDRQTAADQIRALVPEEDARLRTLYSRQNATDKSSDDVQLLELRHLPTPAVPEGRCMCMVGRNILLYAGPNRYSADGKGDLGCYRINSARRFGTPRGYSSAHDLLGLQVALDVLTSIVYSNQRALGGNVLLAKEGSGLRAERLKKGLSVVYSANMAEAPQVLNLLRTAPEIFAFRKDVIQEMGNLEGLDQLSMGREERQLSGAAMALLDTRTQRAVSALSKAYARLLQDMGNAVVRRMRMHATGNRKFTMLSGKSNRARLVEFKPGDLAGIDRVKVDTASALMRTESGRLEIGDKLLLTKQQNGAPMINAEQYLALITTGKLEPLTEGPMANLMNIKAENEKLSSGEALEVQPTLDPATGMPLPGPEARRTAVLTDNHPQHIFEHTAVLASPEARSNQAVVEATLAHIQAHVELWRTTDPAVLSVLGIQPPPPVPQAVGPGQPMPQEGQPPPAPAQEQAPQPHRVGDLPQLPVNKATGERYSPTGAIAQ